MRRVQWAVIALMLVGTVWGGPHEVELVVSAERTTWDGEESRVYGVTLLTPGWEISADRGGLRAGEGTFEQVRLTCAEAQLVFDAEGLQVTRDGDALVLQWDQASVEGLFVSSPWGRGAPARLTVRPEGWLLELSDDGGHGFSLDDNLEILVGAGDWSLAMDAQPAHTPLSQAMADGLGWLAAHQSEDGRWDADGWGVDMGARSDRGDSRYDVGLTGLALLAFVGNGNTHRFGDYRREVQRASRWLCAQQADDGSIGVDHGETIYNHALAATALCELYAVSRDAALRAPAQAAVDWILEAQNPGLGWKYGVRTGRNDTSVTTWMVLALKAGRVADLEVPDAAFEGALSWYRRVTDSRGNVGYETPGGGSAFLMANDGRYDPLPVMTASALIGQVFAGEPVTTQRISQGAALLRTHLPEWPQRSIRTVNFYYWYHGTYAMYQLGGQNWETWRPAVLDVLLTHQVRDGTSLQGSWEPVGEWCLAGGRVYATAMNLLTLEIVERWNRHQR